MKAKTVNRTRIEGRVYDFSNLAIKTVQNTESKNYGKEFIGGSLDVVTDDAGLNVVTVYFTYVTPTFNSGKSNSTYGVLKKIIEEGKSVLTDGFENATVVRIDTALGLNDFYTNRNGEETLVSAKRNVGGFVSIINANQLSGNEKDRSKFEADMLINGTQYVEADEEKNIKEDYLIIKGAVFDFRNAILPVEFIVRDKGGMKYFEDLEASSSNPTFTKVWGVVKSQTIVTKREEESAFGAPSVTEYSRTIREWEVTGTLSPDKVYPIGDEEAGITAEDIQKAMADRNVYLADVKKRADEYQAQKSAGGAAPAASVATASAAEGGFNF